MFAPCDQLALTYMEEIILKLLILFGWLSSAKSHAPDLEYSMNPESRGRLKSNSLLSFAKDVMDTTLRKTALGLHRVETVAQPTTLVTYVWLLPSVEIVVVHST